MKRKVISAILCAAMVVTMAAGCGAKEKENDTANEAGGNEVTEEQEKPEKPEETEEVETPTKSEGDQVLKVAALEGGYGADMWKDVVKAFEESHEGVSVELTIDKKIEDVITPGMKAGDYPDVVQCATGREAGLTETLTKEKGLLDLTDVLDMQVPGEDVTVKDKILPGFLDTLGTMPYNDGVTYYAPMFYSPCGLFYNAGLLEEKGWEVPKTWDQMWELGEKAKAEGIALFTYPTAGYFDAFLFSLLESSGGMDFYNKTLTYDEGIWESPEATAVFELVGKLAEYTESTTTANANDDNFTKNQQLILDNKAIFCPNGTWLPGEMQEAPRAEGFKWGFTAVPAVSASEKPSSFTFFEQIWIPAEAKSQDLAKEFVAFMYSDVAAEIFAKSTAVQPIAGMSEQLEDDNQLFYQVYDNGGAVAVMGDFATTEPVEGVTMRGSLCDTVNSIVSGDKTVADWQSEVESTSGKLRAAMN